VGLFRPSAFTATKLTRVEFEVRTFETGKRPLDAAYVQPLSKARRSCVNRRAISQRTILRFVGAPGTTSVTGMNPVLLAYRG
jgi:hypothetical protein